MSKLKSISLILGVLIMSFLIGYLVFAWIEPSTYPPGGNVAAPLNVSTTDQSKSASLTFTAFYDKNNNHYFVIPSATWSAGLSGSVTIGMDPNVAQTPSAPGAKLDIKPSSASALMIRPYGAAAGNTGEIRLLELTANGTNYVGFKATDSLPGNRIYVLPDFPSADSFLKSSSTGVLSWASSAINWPLLAPTSLDGDSTKPSYSFSSDSDTGMYWGNTTKLSFAVDGNMVMRMSSSRVGIGIVDPQAKLDVSNSSTGVNALVARIMNARNNSNYNGLLVNIARTAPNTDAYALDVQTGSTSRLYVRSDGNVGIGTTTPGAKLEVDDSTKPVIMVQSLYGAEMSGSGSGRGIFGSNLYVDASNNLKTAGSHGSYGYSGMEAAWGSLKFYTQGGATTGDAIVTPTARMTIDTSGNVGITGNLTVGGTVTMGWERIQTSCSNCGSLQISCSAGKKILGGGCLTNAPRVLRGSYPEGDNYWFCVLDGSPSVAGTIMGYAICARAN